MKFHTQLNDPLNENFWVCASKVTYPSHNKVNPCADPESFFRGGPTFLRFFFKLIRGERIQIPLEMGHHRPASEAPFKWRFAGGPMVAQH